jgi:mono/diheme cytochrome c family protein
MTNGVPQTEMQGFKGQLPDEMLWQVIAYIRSVSQCQEEKPAATSAHE